MIRKLFLLVFLAFSAAFSQITFYLLPSSSGLTIFNEFQQSLSPEEAAALPPYLPLQLVEREILLGDGISHAAKFRLLGHDFYLLKDNDGRFTGENRKNAPVILSGCVAVGDTIEVIHSGMRIEPVSGAARTPGQGSLIARIFRKGGRCYVLSTGQSPCCGWSTLEPPTAWRKLQAAGESIESGRKADTAMADGLLQKIRARIFAANESYRKYFTHFDSLTNADKSIPRWTCESSGPGLHYVLSAPYNGNDQLAESTRLLRQEIETMLLGSGFVLTGGSGEMVVERLHR